MFLMEVQVHFNIDHCVNDFLGKFPLVASVVASRFLLDSHPFLLEAMEANSLGSLPFQAHLRLFQELFPLATTTCYPHLGSL
jgi:hypothetical protein